MSKAAGTLITTHNATYIPPRFMPGYDGHVPTLKFDYGETYGSGTARYFQDFRYHTMGTSRENPNKEGYFATAYTHRPDLALEFRTRTWDHWVHEPRYRITNEDRDRREELINFSKRTMAHRENYNDKTGTVPKVAHFQLSTPGEAQFRTKLPLWVFPPRVGH